jgi:hypothetical protein
MEGLFEFTIGWILDFIARLLLLGDLINVGMATAIITTVIAMIP